MQITLNQEEILEALDTYVRSQITISENQEISIDLKAGRGENGFTATLDIRPASTATLVRARSAELRDSDMTANTMTNGGDPGTKLPAAEAPKETVKETVKEGARDAAETTSKPTASKFAGIGKKTATAPVPDPEPEATAEAETKPRPRPGKKSSPRRTRKPKLRPRPRPRKSRRRRPARSSSSRTRPRPRRRPLKKRLRSRRRFRPSDHLDQGAPGRDCLDRRVHHDPGSMVVLTYFTAFVLVVIVVWFLLRITDDGTPPGQG